MILLFRLGPSRRFTSTHMTAPREREVGDNGGETDAVETDGGEGGSATTGSGGEGGEVGADGEGLAFSSSGGLGREGERVWLFCAREARLMSVPNPS